MNERQIVIEHSYKASDKVQIKDQWVLLYIQYEVLGIRPHFAFLVLIMSYESLKLNLVLSKQI